MFGFMASFVILWKMVEALICEKIKFGSRDDVGERDRRYTLEHYYLLFVMEILSYISEHISIKISDNI